MIFQIKFQIWMQNDTCIFSAKKAVLKIVESLLF